MNRNEDIKEVKNVKKAIVAIDNCGIRIKFIRNKQNSINCICLLLYRVGKYIKKVTKVAEIVGNYLLFILGIKDHVLVCCGDDEALSLVLATKRMF